jgi:TRAP-type mannitol/chloroaromatic compound transport system permease small subunit
MAALLRLSRLIDALSERLGRLVMWLVLAAVLISAGNAVVRKLFNVSSNAYLEIQWYLFAAVFMLGVGHVMLRNGHVRIDVVSTRLSARANAVIDSLGIVLVIMPLAVIMIDLSWPLFVRTWVSGETSQNAGGLIRWPALLLIPAGFGVLLLQSLSELIKRAAFLSGHRDEPFSAERSTGTAEQSLSKPVGGDGR